MISENLLIKFLKFIAVGFSGVFVDFGVTYFLKDKLALHKYIANSGGFLFATVSNYYLNKIWTFRSNSTDVISQFEKFFIISLIGLIISNLIIYLLNDKLKWNFWLCKFAAIGIISFWNFFANYIYTFAS